MPNVNRANREIERLAPGLQTIARELIAKARTEGLCVGLFEGWRSPERQNHLCDIKASRVRADNPKAYHVRGRAVDIVFLDYFGGWSWSNHWNWQRVGEIGEELGLTWGGRWTRFPDLAHFQLEEDI